jgi:hypothetical protein
MSDSNGGKTQSARARYFRLVRRILSVPLTILVLIYFLFEDLFLGFLRPLFRFLGGLSPFVALGEHLKRLNPYLALVVFLVPFILLEPVKIFSLFWIGIGHFVSGTLLLVTSYVLSLLIVERMFHVTRDQLLSIPWFAWGYANVMKLRAWAFQRLESLALWQALRPLGHRIAASVRATAAWLYGWLTRVLQPDR